MHCDDTLSSAEILFSKTHTHTCTHTHLVMEDCVELLPAVFHHWGVIQVLQKLAVATWVKPLWSTETRSGDKSRILLANFFLNLEKNMQDVGQPRSVCVTTCGNVPGPLIKSALQAAQPFESNNSLWLSLYTVCDAFCHLLYCSLRLVELHERNWPFAKEITISGWIGQRGGEDENNQRKCALTQVYILGSGPLGEG